MESLEKYRKAFISGDNSPLKDLYIEYHDDIIRVLTSKKLDASLDQLEGYLNDAFIILYERITSGQLLEVASVKNYLIGTCINLSRREVESKLKVEMKIDELRLHLYNNYDHKQNNDHQQALMKKVMIEMSKLSDRCQAIITAYYIDGLTMKEIAKYLALSSGDVAKTLKSRCYKKLLNGLRKKSHETT